MSQSSAMPVSDAASPRIPVQPIGLRMRLAHRVARYAPARRHAMRNDRPLVSFSFDDIPVSAAATGARMLEEAGVRGTFFVATSLFGRSTDHWRVAEADSVAALARRGHEIGLHTHAHVPVVALDAAAFHSDMGECRRILSDLVPGRLLQNFAYPYGYASLVHRAILGLQARSSRTTHPGVNAGRIDLHYLCSILLDRSMRNPADIDALIERTIRQNGWLIFTTHDVDNPPSPYGCTPAILEHALDAVRRRGVRIATIGEALDLIGAPKAPHA
ncbi:polysaccharide deacetylase family protein [Labrys wisconsinensis]|nr:polysaccharide deacetylase family protein [Labrys wisconsinensis]